MLEFTVLFFVVLAFIVFVARYRRRIKLSKIAEEVSALIALINMHSVQQSIAGETADSDRTALVAQHLRDGLASVSSGQNLYPATTTTQVRVISMLLENPHFLSKYTAGQGEYAHAKAYLALRELLKKLLLLVGRV